MYTLQVKYWTHLSAASILPFR